MIRDVEVALTVEKSSFRKPERIPFSLSIANRHGGNVALATPLSFGHSLFIKLEDDKGPVPASGSMVGLIPGKDKVLGHGESIEIRRDLLKLENFDFSPLPAGTYTLTVCYILPRGSEGQKDGLAKPGGTLRPKYLSSSAAVFRISE